MISGFARLRLHRQAFTTAFPGLHPSRLLKNEATNSSEAASQDSLGRSPRNPTKQILALKARNKMDRAHRGFWQFAAGTVAALSRAFSADRSFIFFLGLRPRLS